MKKVEERTYKIETAKLGGVRLVSARPKPGWARHHTPESARALILKLIEAIKKL